MSFEWKTTDEYGTVQTRTRWIRITVHHHIDYGPDVWLLSTVPAIFDKHVLKYDNIEDAKLNALNLICQWLSGSLSDLTKVKP